MLELGRQGRGQRSCEGLAQLAEPAAVLLGPGALAFGEDVAVVAEDARDAVHGGRAVGVIGLPQPEQPPEGLVVLIGNMHGREVPAPVQSGEHDGIEAIGLAVFTRLSRNE